jgi:hypothetical protein
MVPERREPADFFLRFCECLNRFDVRDVVVGSEAVAFHGAPRYSADFDTFVLATRANPVFESWEIHQRLLTDRQQRSVCSPVPRAVDQRG